MRVLLCVEGSRGTANRRAVSGLDELWVQVIGRTLGPRHDIRLLPTSKRDYVAMDTPAIRPGTPLSILLADAIEHEAPDAILLVWDLLPPWDPGAKACRWDDCLNALRGIVAETELSAVWRSAVSRLLQDYEGREEPRVGRGVSLKPMSIELICVEQEIETLFLLNEREIRRILGVQGKAVDWPRWPQKPMRERDPKGILAKAVRAASPKLKARIFGDFREYMHEWEAFLLRGLLATKAGREALELHPAWKRLQMFLG
jgi:hypothetical protein